MAVERTPLTDRPRVRSILPDMGPIIFPLQGDHIELNQLMKLTGFCASGGAGKMLVGAGLVMVDGSVELRKTCKIRAGQLVRYGDKEIMVQDASTVAE